MKHFNVTDSSCRLLQSTQCNKLDLYNLASYVENVPNKIGGFLTTREFTLCLNVVFIKTYCNLQNKQSVRKTFDARFIELSPY